MVNSFQNSTIAQIIDAIINQLSFEGESNSDISDILLSILNQTPYEKETDSVIAELCIKLKAKIEGESFEPFEKPYISNIAEIINSILNETEYNDAPNSRIAELLLELKEQIEEDFTELTASGAIASFETNVSKPLVNLTAYFKATQEAGTPTPQNPKAISGVSELSIKHSGSDMTDYDEYIVNLDGTYYGGQVIVDKDGKTKLRVTHKRIDLSTLTDWARTTTYTNPFFRATLPNDCAIRTGSSSPKNAICDSYSWYSGVGNYWTNIGDNEFYCAGFGLSASNRIYIRNDDYEDKDTFINSLNGVFLVYELATPYEIDLPDTEQFVAYVGANNIWNDSSDSEVTYLYKGQPETANLLSSNNFGGLLGMDTGNDETGNVEDDAETLQIETDNSIME